ncbi:MAG TPA: transposase [Candidatus Paceibacterota bacterium]
MELYHILNRGIDGRKLFLDSRDYARFVHDLYEFNDTSPAPEFTRRDIHDANVRYRKRLVEIHGWCLMKDHYHLLISELIEGGLIKFMMKVNVGYAKYYNERYERHGHLFQGKTKKILIEHEAHFLYILNYLHLNPLDYLTGAKKWRERDKGSIKNTEEALKYLNEYRWSSYLDYCGKKNFPSILSKNLFGNIFGNYQEVVKDYLKDAEASSTVDFILE